MVTRDSTTEVLPSGLMTEKIPNLKRRQRSKYYRRITVMGGEMVWVQTELLPSDVEGRAYYEAKGFRLTPPEGTEFAHNKSPVEENKDGVIRTLQDEIASLKAKLEDKGKQEGSGKVGRPKRQVGG